MSEPRKLTPKQKRFVVEYMIDMNATQAAKRAGYSPKTAEDIGRQLLRKTPVADTIAAKAAKVTSKLEVTAERVLAELAKIGYANMLDYVSITSGGEPFVDLSALTKEQAAAIGEVTIEDFKDGRGEDARDVRRVKFKLHDKRAALVDLGRYLKLFVDKVEVDVVDRAALLAAARKRVADGKQA